jgi:tetratricopeptide (TPR) repeat protein
MTSRDAWFRNTTWDGEIETHFFEKLGRARDKAQRLRIQASYLAEQYPDVALRLLDRYFELGDEFDHAMAYAHRAEAFVAIGEIDQAINAYHASLTHEEKHPGVQTNSYLDFSMLVATRRLRKYYDECLRRLASNAARAIFPREHFLWHAIHALILDDLGETQNAIKHSRLAIAAAAKSYSGLPRHPNVGIVGDNHANVRVKLLEILNDRQ